MKSKATRKISIFEIIWYSLTGAVGIWGLTYIVLGLIAQYYPTKDSDNPLLKASNVIAQKFGLGFLWWGVIILAIATVCAVVVLIIFGKREDKIAEKEQRRAARLASLEEDKVVDVEATPVTEEAPTEPVSEEKAE